jgi:diketogulonate reductase-like aldo/keto reductase
MNYFNTQMGFGTANHGNSRSPDRWEWNKNAMRYAINAGYKVFDTAEMYGDGKSETMLGEVLRETKRRDKLHIVSKVLPTNANTVQQIIDACRASIQRMDCVYIDTYLLHWRQPPTSDLRITIEAFAELKSRNLIKNYGVSSFPKRWMIEWQEAEKQMGVSSTIATNQVHYSLTARAPEKFYMDWQCENNIMTMAFSPVTNERNSILTNETYLNIAQEHGYNPVQLALAWCIRRPDVIAIPYSNKPDHIQQNFEAQYLKLTPEVISAIEAIFPLI